MPLECMDANEDVEKSLKQDIQSSNMDEVKSMSTRLTKLIM